MKRLLGCAVLCVAVWTVEGYSQCEDSLDPVLCVYPHPDGNNGSRDIRDGKVSSFWNNWESKDFILMKPPENCYPGRCGFEGGAGDASLEIKAVATSYGLYMLSVVTDNVWVDPASPEDSAADAIDFYFDASSSDSIWTCPDCKPGGYCALCTYTTVRFQVWMGATGMPAQCRYAVYNDELWCHVSSTLTWDELETRLGIRVDVISLSPTQKALEWFFPWESYGKPLSINPIETQLDGRRLAFAAGYNDKDGDSGEPDCLWWRGKDPRSGDQNYLGDLLLQSGIQAAPTITVLAPNGGEVWAVGAVHTITWSWPWSSGTVKIELSTDSGSTWSVITPSAPSPKACSYNTYDWSVSADTSRRCLVRVSDALDGVPVDASDGVFAIEGVSSVRLAPAVPGRSGLTDLRRKLSGGPSIGYALVRQTDVLLQLYGVDGRRMARLVEGRRPAGSYVVAWDGAERWGQASAGTLVLMAVIDGKRYTRAIPAAVSNAGRR